MKKKLLPVAMAAALAGGVQQANAVFVNADGLGQVLIYPFYTVEGGQDTFVNVVNTTNRVKAVKVRILEAMNSQEVLDFNLYLSPNDHWSAAIFADGNGASIRTADTTCTVPRSLASAAEGQTGATVPFRATEYSADSVNGVARTREGYVEIIEMGVLPTGLLQGSVNLASAATHVNGVPANCGALTTAWGPSGVFNTAVLEDPTGGLYGYGVIIDVEEGTNASYDAIALDDFFSSATHTDPGSQLPGLAQAEPQSIVFDTSVVPATAIADSFLDGIDAVSAVFMHDSLKNDFVLEPSIAAGTDWVINFPTKREYTNTGFSGTVPNDALPPFTTPWSRVNSQACESIAITFYDREERGQQPDELDFSPLPPGAAPISLCYEANVVTFNESEVLEASSRVRRNLEVPYNNGWMTIGLANDEDRVLVGDVATYEGLPVIGFAVQKYVNGELAGGVLSNYAGVINHKYTQIGRAHV